MTLRISVGRQVAISCLTVLASAGCGQAPSCPDGAPCSSLGIERAKLSAYSQISLQSPVYDPVTDRFLSPVDNPTYAGIFEYGTATSTSLSVSPTGYHLDHFELGFSETSSAPGAGTVPRSGPLRMWPAADPTITITPSPGDFFAPFVQHGARLGFGDLTVSATEQVAGEATVRQLTDPTTYTLVPDTAVVPVTAIVVVPNYPSSSKDKMEALADANYQQLLWDDVWQVDATANGSGSAIVGVDGTPKQVSQPFLSPSADLQKAGRFYQPDGIWAQCGIQFRLVDVVVLSMPEEVSRPNDPQYKWRPVEFERRSSCFLSAGSGGCQTGLFNAGPCEPNGDPNNLLGTCHEKVGICDDVERKALARFLVDQARAQPHNDIFGNPLPGMSPLTMPIIFNAAAKNDFRRDGCITASTADSDGFTEASSYALIRADAEPFVPSHEIGHYLGLDHVPDTAHRCTGSASDPPGDARNLMCAFTHQMGPHVYSCQSWPAPDSDNPTFNCDSDPTENAAGATTCAVARTKATALSQNFIAAYICSAGLGTGPEFTPPLAPKTVHDCGPVDFSDVAVTDLCDPAPSLDSDAPDSFGPGDTTVTWSSTNADGQTTTDTQVVTVDDTTPPVFDGPLPLAPVPLTTCGPATLTEPGATDGCGDVTITSDAPASFGLGTTHVTWTATDAAGVPATAVQDVIVTDTVAPIFKLVPGDLTTSTCSGPALGTPVAIDGCGGTVTITNNAPAKFPLGTTVVTWTARDASNNTRTATQRVTVVLGDNSSCCPAGTTVLVGTPNNDPLTGTSGSDCILGRGGQDTINGLGGNDYISGGDGNDVIDGGAGNDLLFGGTGQDTLTGGSGDDTLSGDDGDDTCRGGVGNDALRGGQGQDQLFGEDNDDTLSGDAGGDTLDGGAGNDVLSGGSGTDACNGGSGTNRLEQCEGGAANACTDGSKNGSETGLDCGGGCPACEEGLTCSVGGDCQSLVCSTGVCQDLPGGLAVKLLVDSDWGAGYCVHLEVTNITATPTTNWSVTLTTGASTVSSTSGSSVTPSTGTVVLSPNAAKRIINASQTESGTGFCANRAVSTSGVLPAIADAIGVH